tara:strand:- start:692 stop:1504 length:813 start_codon:yes stop_codon:yes gene_type:complete
MSELKNKFLDLKDLAVKWDKYFSIYENYFKKFKNSEIIFVEIGIFNGGSLRMWKDYFGKNAKIIGIDINPECKKFEKTNENIFVEIGNQSDQKFWNNFFNKYGNVDVVLDDGGHTNLDQIITTTNVIKNINDGGHLIVEDTHTSYVKEYNSSKKYSFISFAKTIIDDINSNIDLDLNIKKKFSLNKYIYSVEFYESMVCFNVDRSKALKNKKIVNKGKSHSIEDLTWVGNDILIAKFQRFLKGIPFIRLNKFTKFLKKRLNDKILKKYFE